MSPAEEKPVSTNEVPLPENPGDSLRPPAPLPSETLQNTSYPTPGQQSVWRLAPQESPNPPTPLPLQAGAEYDLRRLVARGGCGEVWEAVQRSLSRVVAVKKIQKRFCELATHDKLRRARLDHEFKIEAMTTARLDHPNIVPIYDLGTDVDGWPLMAMKLVKGEQWSQILRRDFGTISVPEYLAKHLSIFIDMMQAVAFAHSRGIIHRDLKPTQVMVGEYGEVLLMDWGFAICAGEPVEEHRDDAGGTYYELPTPLTASNPSGTPLFMAPEQTTRNASDIGYHTDIYLLGGTLYFLLTGAYPHDAEESQAALELARSGVIRDPGDAARGREFPPELARIAMQALSHDPRARIPTVREFIERVRAYQAGVSNRDEANQLLKVVEEKITNLSPHEPVSARSGEDVEKSYSVYTEALNLLDRSLALWPQNPALLPLRDRVISGYAQRALSADDLMLARSLLHRLSTPKSAEPLAARVEKRRAEIRRRHLQQQLALLVCVLLTVILLVASNVYTSQQVLARRRIQSERDRANQAYQLADSARAEAEHQRTLADAARNRAEVEEYFATIGVAAATLRERRPQKVSEVLYNDTPVSHLQWEWGRLVSAISTDELSIDAVEAPHATYSPDGTMIATGERSGHLRIWDPRSGRLLKEWAPHRERIWHVSFTPDNTRAITCSFDKTAVLTDIETGTRIHTFAGHSDVLRGADISHDGTRLATTSQDRTAVVWDIQTGKLLYRLGPFPLNPYDAAFSPDGRMLAIASRDGSVSIYNPDDGKPITQLPQQMEAILSVQFSLDSTRIIAAGSDRHARLYTMPGGTLLHDFEYPGAFLHDAAFSPDGKYVAVAADDGVGTLWDSTTAAKLTTFSANIPMWKIQFSPDGTSILATSRGSIRLWNLNRLIGPPESITMKADDPETLSPRNQLRAFGLPPGRDPTWDEREKSWNTPQGRTLLRKDSNLLAIDSRFTAFSPDGLTRIDHDNTYATAVVRRTFTQEEITRFNGTKFLTTSFSPDGRTAILVESQDRITVLDTTTWKQRHMLQMDPSRKIATPLELYNIAAIDISPDSQFLVTPYLNGHIVLWNLMTGEQIYETPKEYGIGATVQYSRDGKLFVISGNDDRGTVWNASTGQRISELIGHTRPLLGAVFSPDGQRIATSSRDHTIKLWETTTGREILDLYKADPGDEIVGLAFTHDASALYAITTTSHLIYLDAFPWNLDDYPGSANLNLQQRVELWKRRHRLSPSISEDALVW